MGRKLVGYRLPTLWRCGWRGGVSWGSWYVSVTVNVGRKEGRCMWGSTSVSWEVLKDKWKLEIFSV